MRVVLDGERGIRLELAGEGFEITSDGTAISPYHLLAASLGSCTALTVASWAHGAGIGTERLVVSVSWEVVSTHPKRIAHMEQVLHWPELPEERLPAADRVAKFCPIHVTLNAGTLPTSRVQRD